jgi:FAD/FMN-containing dehydrogenase
MTTLETTGRVHRKHALSRFRKQFGGDVITLGDPRYDEARRVWNGLIDRYPLVIARCADARDAAAAIAFSREQGLPLAVRGGGHHAAGFGTCDGGVVVDLARMRTVEVDRIGRRAAAGGGVLWAELDRAAQTHGLAVTGGLVTHTGIGGLTLGGGIGNLMRRCGLTCDNLIGAELVTADGAKRVVSEEEDPDLLWGLRGGGGNFGVVTRFVYRLHEVGPMVIAGLVMYPLTEGAEVLRFYRDWAATLPDAMTTVVALRAAPASPHLPPDVHGQAVVAISVCWSGSLEEGERVLEPLRRFKRPLVDLITLKPYVEHQSLFDASAPPGRANYKQHANLSALSDAVIDVLIEHTQRLTSPFSVALIFQLGGAILGLKEDATAYSDRGAMFNVDLNAQWLDPHDARGDEHIRWVRDFRAALHPFARNGAYVNFLMDEGHDRVRSAYGPAKYERLAALKQRYDPENVFRGNQNIRPGI